MSARKWDGIALPSSPSSRAFVLVVAVVNWGPGMAMGSLFTLGWLAFAGSQ